MRARDLGPLTVNDVVEFGDMHTGICSVNGEKVAQRLNELLEILQEMESPEPNVPHDCAQNDYAPDRRRRGG